MYTHLLKRESIFRIESESKYPGLYDLQLNMRIFQHFQENITPYQIKPKVFGDMLDYNN